MPKTYVVELHMMDGSLARLQDVTSVIGMEESAEWVIVVDAAGGNFFRKGEIRALSLLNA